MFAGATRTRRLAGPEDVEGVYWRELYSRIAAEVARSGNEAGADQVARSRVEAAKTWYRSWLISKGRGGLDANEEATYYGPYPEARSTIEDIAFQGPATQSILRFFRRRDEPVADIGSPGASIKDAGPVAPKEAITTSLDKPRGASAVTGMPADIDGFIRWFKCEGETNEIVKAFCWMRNAVVIFLVLIAIFGGLWLIKQIGGD